MDEAYAVMEQARQCEFHIGTMCISAERWGREGATPVLALHGWLDNAASFAMIAPHLKDIDLLAIDLPGHGKSQWRDGLGAYNIWQDLSEIFCVLDELGWQTFYFLGHSRGAMISTLFAGTFPERVRGAFLIDALTPYTANDSELPEYIAETISSRLKLVERPRNYYASLEDAVSAREKGMFPVSRLAAQALARRGVRQNETGYYWNYDPRLLSYSEIRFSPTQCRAFVDRFKCKARVVAASKGILLAEREKTENGWWSQHPMLEFVDMPGSHHLHLSGLPETILALANDINEYIL